jgi:hypothetical protein
VYESFTVSVDSSMNVNPKVSFVVKYACNAISYFCLVLAGYLMLFGVGTTDGLLGLRMVLRSVV